MPDFTMCKGVAEMTEGQAQVECPVRFRCLRATASPGYRQSWFAELPLYADMASGRWCCNYYIPDRDCPHENTDDVS